MTTASVRRAPAQGQADTPFDAAQAYRIPDWGLGYFAVSDRGTLLAAANCGDEPGIDLLEIVQGLRDRGLAAPLLLRFSDILADRLRGLNAAFAKAIQENSYKGGYRAVYPIKVNQQHQVVEEVSRFGAEYGCGLEVGSKPELLAVMALTSERPEQIILCNGFKDATYIEAVVLATKLGRTIIPIVESLEEVKHIIRSAKKYQVRPRIGVRVKLASRGEGRWKDSAGIKSKFGLFVAEVLEMLDMLRAEGMLDSLELLHCHAGSQIQDIRRVKEIVTELAHVYAGLRHAGATGLRYLDVGGGLGVDYQGSQTNTPSSMNYSLEEFASDVVYRVGAVCDAAGMDHPTIITECGRAMVAYSSVLVFDVLGCTGPSKLADRGSRAGGPHGTGEPVPQPIADLRSAYDNVSEERLLEYYHDAVQARDTAMILFSNGYLDLEQRAEVDRLFWATCLKVRDIAARLNEDELTDELRALSTQLSDIYFCNFSIFQSLPDCWAIDQLFPVVPIHRLHERPTRRAVLADITCDSDGQLDQFVGDGRTEQTLLLHDVREGEPYYLGAFLVGAYQETLGDLHNLFGDTHVVHIRKEDGTWAIEEVVKGDTNREVLRYMQHEPDRFAIQIGRECERAVRRGAMNVAESQVLLRFYEQGLDSYTYLDRDE